jgi:hypothetical protein
MFSVGDQESGSPGLSATGMPAGPNHPGQLSVFSGAEAGAQDPVEPTAPTANKRASTERVVRGALQREKVIWIRSPGLRVTRREECTSYAGIHRGVAQFQVDFDAPFFYLLREVVRSAWGS